MKAAIEKIKAITKRELSAYFSSPVAYVFIVIFLLLTGFFTFTVGDFFESGQANLGSFFVWHPWLYLFLVPCVGMRLWAEERRVGTLELLLTKPVTLWQAIVGKFLASWIFLGISLALTFPVLITVNYLGSPDNGLIVATYLGSLLMAGAYLAISCMTSAMTRNQVVSFILSVVICLFLVLCGFAPVTNLLTRLDRPWVVNLVSSLSVMTHFQPFVSGMVDSRDVVFFLLIITFALFTNGVIIRSHQASADRLMKRKQFERIFYSAGGVAAVFVMLVSLYIVSGAAHLRFDITADKANTLSAGTKKILDSLDSRVTLRFYCTQSGGAMPPPLKVYSQHIEDLLHEYEREAKGHLVIEKFDPQPDSEAEDSARLNGVEGRATGSFDSDKIYLGVAVSLLDKKFVLPWLSPDRERMLEYDLSRAIDHVVSRSRPVVGVMTGLPVWGNPASLFSHPGEYHPPDWAFITELKKDFDVREIPMTATNIPDDVTVLLVAHPVDISDTAQYAIDQLVLRGGKLLAFLDPHAFFDQEHARSTEVQMAGDAAGRSSLDKLLKAWGLDMDMDKVVADMSFATRNMQNGNTMPTLLFVTRAGINQNDVVTCQMDNLAFPFAGAFTGKPVTGLTETVLVKSSANSMLVDNLMATAANEQLLQNFKTSNVEYPLAVRLNGTFKTAFPAGNPAGAAKADSGQLKGSTGNSEVVLVSDTDLLNDRVSVRMQNTMGRRVYRPVNGNLNFVQSLVEEMAGDDNLISARSRASMDHPFTRVKDMEAKAGKQWEEKIQVLENRQRDMDSKIKKIQTLNENNQSTILSSDQERVLEMYQKSMTSVSRELNQVRKNLRKDTEALEFRTKVINIGAMPLAVILSGLALAMIEAGRKPNKKSTPRAFAGVPNQTGGDTLASRKQFLLVLLAVALVGGAGLVLLKHNQQAWTARDAKVDEKVFPDFPVNKVAAIHVKGAADFNVARVDGLWHVRERDDYPANFGMIGDFLLKIKALKVLQSDEVGSSQLGGLDLNEPGSGDAGATLFEFKDERGAVLASLLVGKKHDKPQDESTPLSKRSRFDSCYVLLPRDRQNVLLASDELAAAQPDPESWLSRDFFKVENIRFLSMFSTNPADSWEISRENNTAPWTLDNLNPGESFDTNVIYIPGETLAFPTFDDVVPKTPANLARLGFDKPFVVTALTEDLAYTLKIGRRSANGTYPMTVTVAGNIPSARVAASYETPEDKSKLDAAFRTKTKELQKKLAKGKTFEPWIYQTGHWIEQVIRARSQFIVKKTGSGAQTTPQ